MEYKLVNGSQLEKPKEFEVNVDTVYLRKDIKRVTKTDENNNSYAIWEYLELQLTFEQFARMKVKEVSNGN